MRLLDKELKSHKSSYTRKPEWVLCKYCRVPFLTSTFDLECQRCKVFVKYNIEYSAKVMLVFIFFALMNALVLVFTNIFVYKYTKNIYHISLAMTFETLLNGSILWKIVKKLKIFEG